VGRGNIHAAPRVKGVEEEEISRAGGQDGWTFGGATSKELENGNMSLRGPKFSGQP